MYLPPALRPLPAGGPITPGGQRIAETPLSVVRGAPGSYVAEQLAGAIDNWHRLGDCVWLRARDALPVDLSHSLVAACRQRWSAAETTPHPGRLLSSRLDEGIAMAPEGAVIVLELGSRVTPEVGRLVRAVRPAITARGVRMVVVSEGRFHSPTVPGQAGSVVAASDLFDRGFLEGHASSQDWARLVRYAGRRAAVLVDVMAAAQLWSRDVLTEALRTSYNLSSLLSRLTTVLLDPLTPDQRGALEVALSIGYWHPQMGTQPVAAEQLRPWVVPMEQQWGWLRPIWAPPLRSALARPAGVRHRRIGSRPDTRATVAAADIPPRPALPAAPTGAPSGLPRSRSESTARPSGHGTGNAAPACFATCCRVASMPAAGTSCSRSSGPTSRPPPPVTGSR
jgi:hypothetical protein